VRVDLLDQHFEPWVANPGATPCAKATAGRGDAQTLGPVQVPVTGPLAVTRPGTSHVLHGGAFAYARVGDAVVPNLAYMTVSGLQSSAVGTCRNGVPAFGGTANVARIYTEADGKQPELPDEGVPATIPLPGVGTLVVNEKIQTPTSMTRRALRVDTPFFDIVLGESRVSIDACPVRRPAARVFKRVRWRR
jgi:hypothetical protein